jgi:hypothetical protein
MAALLTIPVLDEKPLKSEEERCGERSSPALSSCSSFVLNRVYLADNHVEKTDWKDWTHEKYQSLQCDLTMMRS